MWLLDKFLTRAIRNGHLTVTDHDGKVYEYGKAEGDERIGMRLTHTKAASHIARYPQLGAGEAYMWGWLVVEEPHDIRDLVLFVTRNAKHLGGGSLRAKGPLRKAAEKLRAMADGINPRGKARKNAEHHYNLTREFYELFLDEDRQYTMAYWRDPENGTLEQAQLDKKALIAAKLGEVTPGMRVLDIGCGWGGMALYLNRMFGCEVLGVSLAPDQVAFSNKRAEKAGVADKVRFELMDYRDVPGTFDRITSVGMIEAIGQPHFDEYFAKTHELLAPDGIMLTHTIGRTGPPGMTDAWTRKYIFPGGYIPAMSELVAAMERQRWEVSDVEVLRYHYAHTLQEWYRRARLHRDRIVELFDAEFYRMWMFYLAGAEQSFRNGGMVNFHIQSVKSRDAVPMTRDYIVEESARLRAADKDNVPEWHLDPGLREATE
jgi:cyclopropane-fatty-acyl-phospholipid synthase